MLGASPTRPKGCAASPSPGETFLSPSGSVYRGTSLFCLRPSASVRLQCISIVESSAFDSTILAVIMLNCLTMAWESPLDPAGTWKAQTIDMLEWLFLLVFTTEMVLKIVAKGFVGHSGSYISDAWCQLDFVIVVLSWAPILYPSFGNYSIFRVLRALRPLRALKRVPGMPMLVHWILTVLPKMGSVLMLCSFLFLVFGIVGVQLFKGVLRHRCALPGFEQIRPPATADERSTQMLHDPAVFDSGISCNPAFGADSGVECWESACPGVCPKDTTCSRFNSNPSAGLMSFDSIGLAALILLEAVTFDEWSSPMYSLMASLSPYVWSEFARLIEPSAPRRLRLSALVC